MLKEYYKILGASEYNSLDEIKSLYRKKAREVHPDLNPNDPEAAMKFRKITEAYNILLDRHKQKPRPKTFNNNAEVMRVYRILGNKTSFSLAQEYLDEYNVEVYALHDKYGEMRFRFDKGTKLPFKIEVKNLNPPVIFEIEKSLLW